MAARPQAILFDWDNTLADNWVAVHAAVAAAQRAMGYRPWSADEARRNARSLRDSFPEMFGDRWQEARDVFYRTFEERHLELLVPSPGAEELLAALHERKIYLAVVSNKTGRLVRAETAHLGWERYFGAVIGANDAVRDKPAPEPIDLALKPAGLGRGPDVWVVGDTQLDMECSVRAGCRAVLLRPEPPRAHEFGDFHPHLHVESCDAFRQLVERL